MASKTQSSLSNKSSAASVAKASTIKVSELLQALPSATTLRTESAAAPAAEQRRREFEERKATREARIEHTRALRNSYADYLITQFVSQVRPGGTCAHNSNVHESMLAISEVERRREYSPSA